MVCDYKNYFVRESAGRYSSTDEYISRNKLKGI